jgi:hypothetical protein
MPFAVEICSDPKGIAWDAPEIYEGRDIVIDVLTLLGSMWVAGDVELPNTFTFLAAHGHDLGITDDNYMDEPESLRLLALELVLELCADNEAITSEYLIAIADRVRIVKDEDDDDPV